MDTRSWMFWKLQVETFFFCPLNITSTSTLNVAQTGRWSENLNSLRTYKSCCIPLPCHKILSHLQHPSSFRFERKSMNIQFGPQKMILCCLGSQNILFIQIGLQKVNLVSYNNFGRVKLLASWQFQRTSWIRWKLLGTNKSNIFQGPNWIFTRRKYLQLFKLTHTKLEFSFCSLKLLHLQHSKCLSWRHIYK